MVSNVLHGRAPLRPSTVPKILMVAGVFRVGQSVIRFQCWSDIQCLARSFMDGSLGLARFCHRLIMARGHDQIIFKMKEITVEYPIAALACS
jgi:hypothetical protein